MSFLSLNQRTTQSGHTPPEIEDKARCLPCHFRDEERVLYFFPQGIRRRILLEHQAIEQAFKSGRTPRALLESHAEFEDEVFPRFLPPALSQSFLNDHASYRANLPGWACGGERNQ